MKLTKASTAKMSEAEWHDFRRHSIGGSDAGAILGLNPYKSAYALWAEKTGKIIPDDISDVEAVRLGHDLEDYVAKRFSETTGKKVRRVNNFIVNSDYPFAHALPDRMIVGEKAGLECKTTSSYDVLKRCRAGEYPESWYCQIVHYMMVTGADRWYLEVLCLGAGAFNFTIERDDAEIDALAAAERDFWANVTNGKEPPIDGSEATRDAIETIYSESNADSSIDLTAVSGAINRYLDLKDRKAEIDAEMNKAAAEIEGFMKDAEKGRCDIARVSWKTQQTRTFDRKSWEKANGAIPAEFFKINMSRPLRITRL